MPIFTTPQPIDLAINVQVGAIDVIATDRQDTLVTVAPTNPGRAVDVRGADETTVAFDGQRLTVVGPRPRISVFGPSESIDVTVELPTGSRLSAELAVGALRTQGRLGATRVKNSTGPVDIAEAGDVWVRASHGNATVGHADGNLEVTADHGQIRATTIAGDAILKASHGSIRIGSIRGELDAKLSYGDLEVESASSGVTAKTAYGTITLASVSNGSVQLDSGYGQITVGVRPGVPAWLDLASKDGHVRNRLEQDHSPAEPAGSGTGAEASVAVRARTKFGDITVQAAG